MINKIHVKKGETVKVISGKDKGKEGKVLVVMPKTGKVIVEGINIATKHTKARKQGDVGGIVKQEAPISASKVMYVCDKCKNAAKVGKKVLADGTKVRFCKKCNEVIDN
ncbi:MAG: 50S ribosomal protein L24 [Ruminococcaceae bacterium]|nr:50S ribosomal protein L24 [Oscillospiraceae bacterium]